MTFELQKKREESSIKSKSKKAVVISLQRRRTSLEQGGLERQMQSAHGVSSTLFFPPIAKFTMHLMNREERKDGKNIFLLIYGVSSELQRLRRHVDGGDNTELRLNGSREDPLAGDCTTEKQTNATSFTSARISAVDERGFGGSTETGSNAFDKK